MGQSTLGQGALPAGSAAPGGTGATPQTVEFAEIKATPSLLAQLRKGGYVLYMRHGNTNNDIPDQPQLDLSDCSTQRPLNAQGRAVAKQVGEAIRRARIPVGEVHASPLCRTRETAQLAFGAKVKTNPLLMYTAHLTSAQKAPILAHTRVLVAHAPNMADLIGYFVKPEGTVVVLQPEGDNRFTYLASIHPDMWARLLR
jgi:phosphohistidine phosphatase SixA